MATLCIMLSFWTCWQVRSTVSSSFARDFDQVLSTCTQHSIGRAPYHERGAGSWWALPQGLGSTMGQQQERLAGGTTLQQSQGRYLLWSFHSAKANDACWPVDLGWQGSLDHHLRHLLLCLHTAGQLRSRQLAKQCRFCA